MTIKTAAPESLQIVPGKGGVRVPLPRFINLGGEWGYIVASARPNNGGSYNLTNFIGFPAFFEPREKDQQFNDTRTLMERNSEDNRNENHGFQCWSELWGKHEGEILVIASCGPSLTESLPLLYKHRSKFRLLCLNRSHRAFMDPEVKPDYFYFVERRGVPDWAHEVDGRGAPGRPLDLSGITMIGTPQCDPRIVRRFDRDRRYWGWTSLGALGHLDYVARLKSYDVKAATTIGNAPYIGYRLGFSRIIFVGCDFSLVCRAEEDEKGNKTIAPRRMYFDRLWEHTHYAQDPFWRTKLNPIIGIDGKACLADAQLIGYKDFFSAVLDIVQFEGGVECINASPRGILNWNVRALGEVLEELA